MNQLKYETSIRFRKIQTAFDGESFSEGELLINIQKLN